MFVCMVVMGAVVVVVLVGVVVAHKDVYVDVVFLLTL